MSENTTMRVVPSGENSVPGSGDFAGSASTTSGSTATGASVGIGDVSGMSASALRSNTESPTKSTVTAKRGHQFGTRRGSVSVHAFRFGLSMVWFVGARTERAIDRSAPPESSEDLSHLGMTITSARPTTRPVSRTHQTLVAIALLALSGIFGCQGPERSALGSGASDEARQIAGHCDRGDPYACNNLGSIYEDGDSVDVDLDRAAELFGRACDGGAYFGCYNAGRVLSGQDPHSVEAQRWLTVGCDNFEGDACRLLANLLVAQDGPHDEIVALYTEACDLRVGEACAELAAYTESLGADEESAFEQRRRGCDAGSPEACGAVAEMYLDPTSERYNQAIGLELLQRACAETAARACWVLSGYYARGDGVDADPVYATELRTRGCVGGVTEACVSDGSGEGTGR